MYECADVNNAFQVFYSKLSTYLESSKYIVQRETGNFKRLKLWMTAGLSKAFSLRDKLFKRYKRSPQTKINLNLTNIKKS